MSNTIYNRKIIISTPLVHDENGYYHLVYCVTNVVNNKIYIGKHTTKNPYDNYMGSGKQIFSAIKKYGIENFTKEILFCFTTESEAFLKEEEIVTQEFIDRDDTYNMMLGGKGCKSGENNHMYGRTGEKNPMYGVHRYGEKNPMYGKHLSQEARDKLSKAHKGLHVGEKNPMYGRRGEKNPMYGRRGENCPNYGEKSWMYGRRGENCPNAKAVLKLDIMGNIIAEYGCVNDCCAHEQLYRQKLRKLIIKHVLYNGFYFEFKTKE